MFNNRIPGENYITHDSAKKSTNQRIAANKSCQKKRFPTPMKCWKWR